MITLSEEVAEALQHGLPVVALESTVYSNLGLPTPANEEALNGCLAAIRAAGAVPAITAVIDGVPRAGLSADEHPRILGEARKVAERDLAVAVAQRWPVGATTVSASLAIAAQAEIPVFATGGIGGVHREVAETGDVSADLEAVARHGVATVCAGAKSFLDLARTLQQLETLGVPVIGWQTDELPAFTARTSGLPVPHRVDEMIELVAVAKVQRSFSRGMLVVNPVPVHDALDQSVHDEALAKALVEAEENAITGPAVTPFVLDRIARASDGRSVPANVSLVANNAALAGRLAAGLCSEE